MASNNGRYLAKAASLAPIITVIVGWTAADRRIDQFDPARPAGFGDAGDGLRRIGGQVDMGGTWLQPGEDAGLRFQHRRLKFGGAGSEVNTTSLSTRRGEGAVRRVPHLARTESRWPPGGGRKPKANGRRGSGSPQSGFPSSRCRQSQSALYVCPPMDIISQRAMNDNSTERVFRVPATCTNSALSDATRRYLPLDGELSHQTRALWC